MFWKLLIVYAGTMSPITNVELIYNTQQSCEMAMIEMREWVDAELYDSVKMKCQWSEEK